MEVDLTLLFSKVQEDDEASFKEIYLHLEKKIYGFCINNGQSHADAEEVLQDVFLKIWNNRKSINPNNVQAYIFSIAKNVIIDKFRRLVKVRAASKYQILFFHPENDTENTVLFNELQGEIQKTFDSMPKMRKLIFQMSRFKGCSNKEIAIELGISIRTVENHISKALQVFKNDLGQYSAVITYLLLSSMFFQI